MLSPPMETNIATIDPQPRLFLKLHASYCLEAIYPCCISNPGTPSHPIDVVTPLWEECEDETHTPEMGTWESTGTPETSEFYYKGQNTSHYGVLYIIGNLLKCRCRKWARMSHLDICITSYGKKKGRKSNWQFDSQPLQVRNRPDPSVWRWSAAHR
jgi:hypothetical protein